MILAAVASVSLILIVLDPVAVAGQTNVTIEADALTNIFRNPPVFLTGLMESRWGTLYEEA
jgi:hypothetical protein